jgi:hypothetical protein
MTDLSEAPGSNYQRPASASHELPREDRGLADMLSREIPRALPIGLAALAARVAEALRSREAWAKPAAASVHDRDLPGRDSTTP